jgi:hypothetical protein
MQLINRLIEKEKYGCMHATIINKLIEKSRII